MIRSFYCTPEGDTFTNLKSEHLLSVLKEGVGTVWVDIVNEPKPSSVDLLQNVFGFHPLAVDDALEEAHSPKIDDWGEYLYMVLHAVTFDADSDGLLDTHEVDIFLGRNYLVTYRSEALQSADTVWSLCRRDERYLNRGVTHLAYRLIDEMVGEYMPVVEAFDEMIDRVEDQVFDGSESALLEEIFRIKRALLLLRRILAPQREVLNKLARGDYAVIAEEHRMFFRDVYDHLVRMYDIVDSMRDLMGGVLDTYLSVVNNRMNEVMKTLTVITTLFMPLSFVAGFFGMNFFGIGTDLESWTGTGFFIISLLAMILVPVAMYLWMRKRAWM